MGIKEKDLPSASGVSGTDYMREVTSGGLSYKALVADVAKYIVENYTGSSLAGSSQSIMNALNGMYEKMANGTFYLYNFNTTTTAKSITLGNNFRGLVFTFDGNSGYNAVVLLGTNSSGVLSQTDIHTSSRFSITDSGGGVASFKTSTGTQKTLLLSFSALTI